MKIKPIHYTKDITVFQLRAARYALGISYNQVRLETGISTSVLNRVEKGILSYPPQNSLIQTIYKLRSLYESRGIIFLENNVIQYDAAGDGVPNYIRHIEEELS